MGLAAVGLHLELGDDLVVEGVQLQEPGDLRGAVQQRRQGRWHGVDLQGGHVLRRQFWLRPVRHRRQVVEVAREGQLQRAVVELRQVLGAACDRGDDVDWV
ncbi:hypothetical protein [Streptomyces sp. NPDC048425]|uniref:hypothetical protein n=1 Tax=Streptomyces sp. NPDC048425 TaxID=3365548 RepID=UPI0037100CCC